ncbi:septum formation initiator family protein [Marinoscillum sp. MHG1-6]|uniref:FtsB family cell division protein n=1 Tax=Marinoscillum sp. MHG1-6 TaxID=2959627 RepID=UPI0021574E9A|nr:septum formation initiator family protein [Marinoscillum sp. MHG1-6]
MKELFQKIPPFFRNFYFLAAFLFLIWMLFFDTNDIITQARLNSKESELENSKAFYEEKIIEVKNDQEALLNDKELLEEIAREKYLMKKEDEDVYIVVEE